MALIGLGETSVRKLEGLIMTNVQAIIIAGGIALAGLLNGGIYESEKIGNYVGKFNKFSGDWSR